MYCNKAIKQSNNKKGEFFMGFQRFCAECGKKTNILTRTELSDENYLCSDCSDYVPYYMLNSVSGNYTLSDFREFKNYMNTTNKDLKARFRETKSFYNLHLDSENRIFYIGSKIKENTVFMRLFDIEEFDLIFSPNKIKEGMLGDKVYGKIILQIKSGYPYFYHEEVLAEDVKSSATKKLFGTKVEYENPPDMDDFITFFFLTQEKALDEELNRFDCETEYEQAFNNMNNTSASELSRALALFMFDSMEDLTLNQLRAQRNRLMKAYHPDTGTEEDNKYAQKINNAYEILKKAIEQATF